MALPALKTGSSRQSLESLGVTGPNVAAQCLLAISRLFEYNANARGPCSAHAGIPR